MAKLIYSAITSLDGCVADEDGKFDWAVPDEQVHSFVNEVERPIGTYLLGRRMYEVMRYWDAPPGIADQPPYIRDYAQLWQAAEKIVYSTTLPAPTTDRTTVERTFDVDAVRALKEAAGSDLGVGGAALAAHAIRAGLVDEYHLFLTPVLVGGGTRALPDGVRADLELLAEHRFDSGVVHLHYRTRS